MGIFDNLHLKLYFPREKYGFKMKIAEKMHLMSMKNSCLNLILCIIAIILSKETPSQNTRSFLLA